MLPLAKYECQNVACKRLFLVSQVSAEVPGSSPTDIICPHCKTVWGTAEQEVAGPLFIVTDPLPLRLENAFRQEQGLPPLEV